MIGPGFNMSDQNIKRKEFGTVPKQLGARWQKIPPPHTPNLSASPICFGTNRFWRNTIEWSDAINDPLNLRKKLDIHLS